MSDWIRVTASMPDAEITVLIHCPGVNEPVWLGYTDGELWFYADGQPAPTVTHWMELPPVPEEVPHA